MVLRILFLVVVLYLIVRTVVNLLRAVVHDGEAPPRRVPPDRTRTPWTSPRPPAEPSPRPTDVEDATWVDLD